MDILNFISWIKAGQYRATLPTDVSNLLAVGAKDPSRDDSYLPLAVNAAPLQTLYHTANVTQGTSITTGVTVNALNGIITTVSSTLAANARTSFTVTNPNVVAGSKILVSVQYDEAATGIPVVGVSDIAAGSFKVVLSNGAGVDALNNVVKVHYLIIA
tara:strand:+ start:1527 stop:2000 length:474 start_codon:yes stop_codon:yes gene_type:complete